MVARHIVHTVPVCPARSASPATRVQRPLAPSQLSMCERKARAYQMRPRIAMLRVAVGAALAVAATFAGAGSALAGEPPGAVVVQPFAADSGDPCPMGLTRGSLGWHLAPLGGVRAVDIRGVVVDRP